MIRRRDSESCRENSNDMAASSSFFWPGGKWRNGHGVRAAAALAGNNNIISPLLLATNLAS